MTVFLAKRALPRSLDEPPAAVAEALAQLPSGFGQQSLESPTVSLNLKKMEKPAGAWRLRVGDWRAIFFPSGEDFLVAAIGQRKDIYERMNRMRLARKGDGVTVIESTVAEEGQTGARTRAARTAFARTPKPVEYNNLSPFEDRMLRAIDGVGEELLAFLRSLPPSVDAAEVLAERIDDVDLAFLLADLWQRPQHHLDTFAAGDIPSVTSMEIEEQELAARLTAAASETAAVATTTAAQIRKLLDRSIEDWMVYLHPAQRAIANATFTGPSRVRGGPGTGKTVVALHRARVLARQRVHSPEKVLLTTFLSTLPKVWESLMGLLDPAALERLEIRNVDVLARSIVASSHQRVDILDDARRRRIAAPLVKRHGLEPRIGNNEQLLLDEFDAFLSGRGIGELEPYLALRRRGGGSPLGRADRERVFAAYEEYCARLAKDRVYDWAHLRAEALRLAIEGAGPRFDGVIVDEAQDLSAVGMRLLLALDTSSDHRHFMIVGDGQQSIYPGGFALRELGIDIVGRSRVLTANWRNTWSVWTAAKAVVEGQEFDDLDEDVGLRPTGEEPEPLKVGDPAELHLLRSSSEELELLSALVAERLEAGIDPGDIAVLVDVKRKGDEALRALDSAGIATHPLDRYEGEHAAGVLVGTFNRAKGLEFKEVLIPGMAASEWPSRWFVPPGLDEEQRAERVGLQLRTLFVGMTRARDRLVLLSAGPPNEWVEAARWTMDVREY